MQLKFITLGLAAAVLMTAVNAEDTISVKDTNVDVRGVLTNTLGNLNVDNTLNRADVKVAASKRGLSLPNKVATALRRRAIARRDELTTEEDLGLSSIEGEFSSILRRSEEADEEEEDENEDEADEEEEDENENEADEEEADENENEADENENEVDENEYNENEDESEEYEEESNEDESAEDESSEEDTWERRSLLGGNGLPVVGGLLSDKNSGKGGL